MLSASAKPERWLWLLTIVGCVFRLYDLGGESLWLDQVVTAKRVYEPTGQIVLGWDSVTRARSTTCGSGLVSAGRDK